MVNHVRRASQNAAIKERLGNEDDEPEIVIVKDMMPTGYDSPPLHTLYLDRPLKGALLMQTLARVNRTYRGKEDGLLVAYAPLADNLQKALSEYTQTTRIISLSGATSTKQPRSPRAWWRPSGAAPRPVGSSPRWRRHSPIHARCAFDGQLSACPQHRGQPDAGWGGDLAVRYRKLSSQLARAWAICGGSETLAHLHSEVRFYEEVRVWMAKFDADNRQSRGEPIPEEIQRLLGQLIAESTVSGEVLDIYDAAGMPKPTLSDLTPDFVAKTQQATLAIEALRKLLNEESTKATRNNVVRPARLF